MYLQISSLRNLISFFSIITLVVTFGCSQSEQEAKTQQLASPATTLVEAQTKEEKRPNVLLIVLDDVGFNDLSIHGSEIKTPNIDMLMHEGVALTNFHVAPTCSPTRSMLFSGTDNHIAGLGAMANSPANNIKDRPGYESYLNFRVAALSELFQDADYHTYMTGKWHLGLTDETSPAARGFDKSFVLRHGGAGHFSNMLQIFGPDKSIYDEDGLQVESLPDDFYSTKFYTERMIEYIDSNLGDGKPFFSYLSYTAPHWPLQAPQESIARYKGVYDKGYEVLKANRLQALIDLGLVDKDTSVFPRYSDEPNWDSLSDDEKRYQSKIMEIYAAMVDDVDLYIGELIDHLKAIGEYENTFIFVTSDNGPEAHNLDESWEGLKEYVAECCDNSYENIGNANSYIWYGQNWGQSGNTPLRMYKGFPSQGGVRVPAFAHYPKGIQKGVRHDGILSVMDVMPTLLEFAGIEHPGTKYRNREVVNMKGESMLAVLEGNSEATHGEDYFIGWELFSKRAIRKGDWTIIYEPFHEVLEPRVAGIKSDTWQLYNIAEDSAQLSDLSENNPGKLAEMIAHWEEYVAETGLVIPDAWHGY
ncbi:MAG: arylsulfatase A-like enzyme [Planctomycetota bacterium]|jgi:arylsulfatase A-like enzyme